MAAAAHPLSVPGENTSLHIFNVPVTDVSIVSSKWVDYEPVQTGTNPIEFVIKPLADYIDINKTELRMVLKITKRDGTPTCLLYTSPSPRDLSTSRMPSSA